MSEDQIFHLQFCTIWSDINQGTFIIRRNLWR